MPLIYKLRVPFEELSSTTVIIEVIAQSPEAAFKPYVYLSHAYAFFPQIFDNQNSLNQKKNHAQCRIVCSELNLFS